MERPDRWMLKGSCLVHPMTGALYRRWRCVLRRVFDLLAQAVFPTTTTQTTKLKLKKFKRLSSNHRRLIDQEDYRDLMEEAQGNQENDNLQECIFLTLRSFATLPRILLCGRFCPSTLSILDGCPLACHYFVKLYCIFYQATSWTVANNFGTCKSGNMSKMTEYPVTAVEQAAIQERAVM